MESFLVFYHIIKYNKTAVEEKGTRVPKMDMKNKVDYVKDIVVSLLAGYTITFLGVVIIAILLLLSGISETVVDIGIIIIYVVSCLVAGYIIGKRTKSKKFLWGFVSGACYFIMLLVLSVILGNSMENVGNDLITVLWICVGSSTLGGMIS